MTAAPLDAVRSVPGVALVFEGGGMRAAVSAPVVQLLLREGIAFDEVCGISAGSSHTINYLARQTDRAKRSFVDFGADPQIGGVSTWLQGKGWFNSDYIYRHTSGPGQTLPLDFEAFMANPAAMRIGAFQIDTGREVYFGRDSVATLDDLVTRVQASSSMPMLMPPVTINGVKYLDGALGPSGGIPVDVAIADGYERFFVVLTRERSYVKKSEAPSPLIRTWWRNHPAVRDALLTRPRAYNATREQVFALEQQGRAIVFAPAVRPPANSGTTDVAKLAATYDQGLAQAEAMLPAWKEWLEV